MTSPTVDTMPVLFVGHGNPMNCVSDNPFTRAWSALGENLPRPKAIVAVSAHWYVPSTRVTHVRLPRTIHDFYGFPQELFAIDYPAAGAPELAEEVADLLKPDRVDLDEEWGLDHGTWSVLRHIYPNASVPVIQLSIDMRKTPEEHFRLGARLQQLRREGVMIFASGNIVHNIPAFNWHNPAAPPPATGRDFESWVRQHLLAGTPEGLIDYNNTDKDAAFAVPTPDHYLPLLYLAGLQEENDSVSFPVEGFDGGSMSMLAVRLDQPEEG